MSTPGAIAVYTSGSGVPEKVSDRPWRGVYHHWDGYPSGLGVHLLGRVRAAKGNLRKVVRQLIDDAPWGWSSCWPTETERSLLATLRSWFGMQPSGNRCTKGDAGLPVSPENTGAVAYVYVFDLADRRLDAFETHSEAGGQRLSSIHFSATGQPDLPAFDLLPEERVAEPPLPGPELTAAGLEALARSLPRLQTAKLSLDWVNASAGRNGALSVVFRVVEWDQGSIRSVVEREWALVPTEAVREPERVRNCLSALVQFLRQNPERIDGFWVCDLDPLRRSGARLPATFGTIFKALSARDQ